MTGANYQWAEVSQVSFLLFNRFLVEAWCGKVPEHPARIFDAVHLQSGGRVIVEGK